MDYPRSVPNVGLVGGKFGDENIATGTIGSLIPSAWGNALTDEILNTISAAGLSPNETDFTQLLQAVRTLGSRQADLAIQQNGAAVAVAAGAADALTGNFAPAITTLTNGMVVYVRALLTNTTTMPTFKADGTGTKAIVKGANQPLVPGDIAGAGCWLELQYDAVLDKWVLLNPARGVSNLVRLSLGQPLPASNIGVIWHDDYNSLMTWQSFNANGAAYTGYASVLIGSLLLDTQPVPRSGYIKSGLQNLSRNTYAALRAWAMHNGIMVDSGVWQAGQIICADNADGVTFRIYDVRAEFFRALDDGRTVDNGRAFGSFQSFATQDHRHNVSGQITLNYSGGSNVTVAVNGTANSTGMVSGQIASETRPRNTALLAVVKF